MNIKQGRNGVEPLEVPSVVGVDDDRLKDPAVVSTVCSSTGSMQIFLVAKYGCTTCRAGYSSLT